jgi:hypothetical protein
MFLTRDEVETLTDAKRHTKQAKALCDMGFRFTKTPAGHLKVLRAEVDRVMLGGSKYKLETPNFDHING